MQEIKQKFIPVDKELSYKNNQKFYPQAQNKYY